jgi:hypothetical protein
MTHPNEPAFPAMDMNTYQGVDRLELRFEGLTKREYIAAQALKGLLSQQSTISYANPEKIVSDALIYADTLIRQLNENRDDTGHPKAVP